jgi:hypothetical protein
MYGEVMELGLCLAVWVLSLEAFYALARLLYWGAGRRRRR